MTRIRHPYEFRGHARRLKFGRQNFRLLDGDKLIRLAVQDKKRRISLLIRKLPDWQARRQSRPTRGLIYRTRIT